MTDLEKRAIIALRDVTMPHQSRHPQLAGQLSRFLKHWPDGRLPIVLAADLWFLVWRYRRQITDPEVVEHADALVNGATHLAY